MNETLALQGVAGPLDGRVFALVDGAGPVTIGRDPANSIALPSNTVSRFHCRLEPDPEGAWFVVDLQSRNRTRVNGRPVERQRIEAGDDIAVGAFHFSVTPVRPPPPSSVDKTDTGRLDAGTILEARPELLERVLSGETLPADRQTVANLNGLLRVSHALHRVRGFASLEREVLETLLEISPATQAAILTEDNGLDGGQTARGLARGGAAEFTMVPISRTLVDRVLATGRAIVSNDVAGEDDLAGARSLLASGTASVVAAPLPVRGETIGVLYLSASSPAKPFNAPLVQLIAATASIVALAADHARYQRSLEEDNRRLVEESEDGHNLVGESARLKEMAAAITRVAPSDTTVLIQGESGTGKELVARAIHRASGRAQRPFVAINCAALTETLLESELFGHEKGAFTGATAQKKGKLEAGEGGTVFLDEIGEMSPLLQAKMLRVLQERECERVGGTKTIRLDIRLIAATNRDLREMSKTGAFRADLYYRLNVVNIKTPPLRDRRPDIAILAGHFAAKYAARVKRTILGISPQARQRLMQYDWPGNVRELENAIERAVVLGGGEWIQPGDLPETVLEASTPEGDAAVTLYDRLHDAKRVIVADALRQTGGNFTRAGELLGIHANHLHRLVRTLSMDAKQWG